MISAVLLGIPSIVIMDYEHVKGLIRPSWIFMPEVISTHSVESYKSKIIKYSGLKEDAYIPMFKPYPEIINDLGVKAGEYILTIRPPATEAHYHNAESEALFRESVNYLGRIDHIRLIILPRNDKQKMWITQQWREWVENGKIIIPGEVVDGLNLLWHSDLVISGGGTMNREAAALGVPVYSIFRGKIGAVDRYLSEKGRLVLIENKDQLYSKIVLARRNKSFNPASSNNLVLQEIVSHIVRVLEG